MIRWFKWHPQASIFFEDMRYNAGNTYLMQNDVGVSSGHPAAVASYVIAARELDYEPLLAPPFSERSPHFSGHFQTITGGSKGEPKRVKRSAESWIASFEINRSNFATDRQSVCILGNLSHSLTTYAMFEALYLGQHAHLLYGQSPRSQADQILKYGIGLIYTTPSLLRRLLLCEQVMPSVSHVIIGGGALSFELVARVNRLLPQAQVVQFYGSAETSFVTMSDAHTPKGSVGRAYPKVDIEIRDLGAGKPLGVGQVGLVWVKSPYLFEGYASQPSSKTLQDDDWITVGEVGMLDADGNLFLEGRLDRRVQVLDKTVNLDSLETQVQNTGLVDNIAIIDVLDAGRVRLYAFYHPRSGHQVSELKQTVLDLLPDGLNILEWHLVPADSWPHLPSGKTNLAALRQDFL